jgi:hypothetical protein
MRYGRGEKRNEAVIAIYRGNAQCSWDILRCTDLSGRGFAQTFRQTVSGVHIPELDEGVTGEYLI